MGAGDPRAHPRCRHALRRERPLRPGTPPPRRTRCTSDRGSSARRAAARRARPLAVGRSTHDRAQLEAAAAEDVDYVAFGPVFGTTSKASEYTARGLEALAEAARRVAPRPLVAIGGIRLEHTAALAAAGAAGFAVISEVAAAPDPEAAARALMLSFAGGAP
ncbi:MAG: thiamine phosphate synthase [Myxococcota bacterium]